MDRANKYTSRAANTTEYRDYFAELVCAIMRLAKNEVFRAVFSCVTFIASLLFVIGIAGGIEMNAISYAVGIPTLVMMLCVLALLHKIRP